MFAKQQQQKKTRLCANKVKKPKLNLNINYFLKIV